MTTTGIVILVGVIAIAALAFWYLFRHRRKRQEPQKEPKVRDFWDWFEIASRFVLALAASTVAWMGFLMQSGDRQRVTNEAVRGGIQQVRAYYAAAESAQRANGAQIAGSLVPFLVRGTSDERRKALLYLEQVSPSLAADLSSVLLTIAADTGEREFARRINVEASERESHDIFLGHIRIARDFFSKRFDAATCDEYLLAWNSLPIRYSRLVDDEKISSGFSICFSQLPDARKGAASLQLGFRNVQLNEGR